MCLVGGRVLAPSLVLGIEIQTSAETLSSLMRGSEVEGKRKGQAISSCSLRPSSLVLKPQEDGEEVDSRPAELEPF